MKVFLIIISMLILFSFIILNINNDTKKNFEKYIHNFKKYNGLCLFDIDGTLTEGKDNYNVVQYFLNLGYAVGVNTAGSIYTVENLKFFEWMPSNLYEFMMKNNFKTFNNVGSRWLCGKQDFDSFNYIDSKVPSGIDLYGWRKGFALEQTAKMFNISNPKKIVMFDDLEYFVRGIKAFNNNFNIILISPDSKYKLNLKTCKEFVK